MATMFWGPDDPKGQLIIRAILFFPLTVLGPNLAKPGSSLKHSCETWVCIDYGFLDGVP